MQDCPIIYTQKWKRKREPWGVLSKLNLTLTFALGGAVSSVGVHAPLFPCSLANGVGLAHQFGRLFFPRQSLSAIVADGAEHSLCWRRKASATCS